MSGLATKICRICKAEKSAAEFSRNRSRKDGLHYNCKPCDSEKAMIWAKNNPEKDLARREEYKRKNRERVLLRDRERYWSSKDKTLQERKAYYALKRGEIIERVSAWGKINRDKTRLYCKGNYYKNKTAYTAKSAKRRSAKMCATPSWLSAIEQAQIQEMYDVAAALTTQTGVKHHVDHIHPLKGGGFSGLHVPWNLQVLRATENLSKGARLPANEAHLAWGG